MKHTLTTVKVGEFVDSSDPPGSYAACREFVESPRGMAKIADVVAHGCALPFSLWASAWRLGNGSRIDAQALARIPVAKVYDDVLGDPEFLPSISLDAQLRPLLGVEGGCHLAIRAKNRGARRVSGTLICETASWD
jgi:hypothetical protein